MYLAEIFLKEWSISIKQLNKCTYAAVKSGRIEMVKFIIENGANLILRKKDLIEFTMINNFVDIFNYIFCPSIDKIYIKNETFFQCMEKNNLEIIQIILSKIAFSKKWINNMFMNCYNCSSEVAGLIIDAGANVKKHGKCVLEKAVRINNKDLIDYLEKIV